MSRKAQVVSRQASGRQQKWVPKGEEEEAQAATEAVVEQVFVEYDTKNEGKHYEKSALLQLIQLYKRAKGKGDVAMVEALKSLSTETRPAEADEGGKTPGARRAVYEQKKAIKQRSDSLVEEEEAAAGPAVSEAMPAIHPMLVGYLHAMGMYGAAMYGPGHTTVMLRNIPNRYTRDMLVKRLNQGYEKQYDFVYLPIDFNSKCNVGYAFINFRLPPVAAKFMQEFHQADCSKVLPGFSSQKVVEVAYARVQGKEQNMENLRDEKFIEKLTEHLEWQPLFLDDSGEEIPFSKTLGDKSGQKKRGRAGSGHAPAGTMTPGAMTPGSMTGGGGFMMPGYPPIMYPAFGGMVPPSPPPTTLTTVLPGVSDKTTLMLKGVPATMGREALIELFNKKFKGQFDFLFLPCDPKVEGNNRGYCFVNFRKPVQAQKFTEEFNQKKMSEAFGVEFPDDEEGKVCGTAPARLESIESSIMRVQGGASGKGKGERSAKSAWYPLLFGPDGSPAPFPMLTGQGAPGAAPPTPSASSGKGKGKGKGKEKGASAAAAAMGYGYGMPGYGYPGYPYDPAMMMSAYQRNAMSAMQHAHAHAAAAAAAHAGSGGMLENLGAVMKSTGRAVKALGEEQKGPVKTQIEFYFSADNLCKDMFLRQHMDADGWTSLDLIATFNKVQKFRATVHSIAEALLTSEMLEVDVPGHRIRLKNEEQREKWAKASTELQEATSPQAGIVSTSP